MHREDAIRRLRDARVGRLATVRPGGSPHVVPFVFALVERGDELRAYWAVDEKPKRSRTIRRLANIEANPAVELVVDGYEEDWARLWWVRASGRARILPAGDEHDTAIAALLERYPQYRTTPPGGPVVAIDIDRVTGWSAEV